MEIGFIPDLNDAAHYLLKWYPGVPQHYSLFGFTTQNLKTDSEKAKLVQTYRCPYCGLLRCYAN